MLDGNRRLDDEARQDAGPRLRVAILGPGGIGGLLGALLAREGHDVTCIAGDRTVAYIAANGLRLRSVTFGDFKAEVRTATSLAEPVDVCFVTPKTTVLDAALERVPPGALGDGLIVPFCNGIDHIAHLRQRYPADQVIAATIRIESTRTAPGEIDHTSPFAVVELAPGETHRERAGAVAAALGATGLQVTLRDDETAMMWDKLAVLGPLALASTVTGAPVGEMRERLGDEFPELLREFVAVANAEGATLDADQILRMYGVVPPMMKPSMLRDAEAGNPTEIDAIGGAVLRSGERHGVPTPVTARIVGIIRDREAGLAPGA
jgi:2-dehydropantoate 2-reductase